MTNTAIDDLLSAVDHDFQSVKILDKDVKLRPVTILECVRLVKRFPKLMDLFEPKVDVFGRPLPEEMQPNLLYVFLNCGVDAAAAFIACACNKSGDIGFENLVATKPDDLTISLFSQSVKVTLGEGSLADFFTKIATTLENSLQLNSSFLNHIDATD